MKPTRLAMLSCELAIATAAFVATAQEPAAADPTAGMSAEQKAMMDAWAKAATPGPQHAQLAQHFVGNWTSTTQFWMDPAAPPMTETARASAKALFGGRQIGMDYSGQMMGAPFEGMSLTGYDNVSGRYNAVWMDNMSTGTYVLSGDYDPASRTYTYTGAWPDPMQAGRMVQVRQTVQVVDPDHHVIEMFESHDGVERRTMRIEMSRAN